MKQSLLNIIKSNKEEKYRIPVFILFILVCIHVNAQQVESTNGYFYTEGNNLQQLIDSVPDRIKGVNVLLINNISEDKKN